MVEEVASLSVVDPRMVDDVLAAIRSRRGMKPAPWPYELLADRYCAGDVLDLMERLADADILEWGVSLRSSWVIDYDPQIEARIAAFKEGREFPEAD